MTIYDSNVDGPLSEKHAAGPGPKTHALIIGVGYYHHLPGGHGATVKESMDLEQLSSPPISARAFAKWVLEDLHNQRAPLGSVELLLSPSSEFVLPNGIVRNPPRAKMQEIQAAFQRWYQRCDTDANNVALFYFCGHGVMRRNLALLTEDYGASLLTPFHTAIDINITWEGMARCKAETQCYFIDSCRQASWTTHKQLDDEALPLISPSFGGGNNRDAPRFMATGPAKSAYGMSGGLTVFTGALLSCLKRGARKNKGRWLVTTQRLSEALCSTMQELSENAERPQFPSPEGTIKGNTIHELPGPPEVPVRLLCHPGVATQHAQLELFLSVPPNKPRYARDLPTPNRWEIRAQAGHYIARATFRNNKYREGECDVWVDPPGPVEEDIPVLL